VLVEKIILTLLGTILYSMFKFFFSRTRLD